MHYRLIILLWGVLGLSQGYAQTVVTVAGQAGIPGDEDGLPRAEARFNNPHGLEVDRDGNVYVADRWNHKIRKIATDGTVTTIAGTGEVGSVNGPGDAASFHEPWGIAVAPDGTVYVADTYNNCIRKIDANNQVTTLSGTGSYGVEDGPATQARFAHPTGIVVDSLGNIIVCDHRGHTIRKITPGGFVTTLAGKAFEIGDADGLGTAARFHRPYGLTIDSDGRIIIADERNHRIRAISTGGLVSTLAGTGVLGSLDGKTDTARFNYPWDVTCDPAGNVFVMDGDNHVVRRISPQGVVSTYVGEAGTKGALDGTGIYASFNGATAISYDPSSGDLYIGDAYNNLVRRITNASINPSLTAQGYQTGDSICIGTVVSFDIRPAIFEQISFSIDGQSVQSGDSHTLIHTFDQTGAHTISADMVDGSGNVFTAESMRLWVEGGPLLSFSHTINNVSQTEAEVDFVAASAPGVSFIWSFGDDEIADSNLPTPRVQYRNAGVFSVTLIGATPFGCTDTVIKTDLIIFNPNPVDTTEVVNPNPGPAASSQGPVFIPTAFTPNGDGQNDILFVRGSIRELNLQVYNSWGEFVFQSQNPGTGWDGYHRGAEAQTGTYVILAKGTLQDGEPFSIQTQVHLLR
ncbi:MAG: SMP-30/gluconolactonase/LRE family protein [Bacteroidia bacterium]